MMGKAHVSHNSGNGEWYTPPEYIEAARRVMGGIDCDPASSAKANEWIKAKVFYTAEQDGIFYPWHGRVWLNPPYSRSLITLFTQTLVRHIDDGTVTEAVVLVNNATETRWFQYLVCEAACACFARHRIRFIASDGETKSSPLQGQIFLYFGPNVDAFAREFSEFGRVWYAWS
jgi:ParB family chromosome partitioning protein